VPGKIAARALDNAGLVLNCNTVPGETRKAGDPSGIRLGTAAVTSRGFGEAEMVKIAAWIDAVLAKPDDAGLQGLVSVEVKALCSGFPAPGLDK